MALSDVKKAQTCVNLLKLRVVDRITEANANAAQIRQAIIDNNLAGQFTAGELTALQTFVTNLTALASSPVVAAINNRYVPSHRAKAVTISGVNDNG